MKARQRCSFRQYVNKQRIKRFAMQKLNYRLLSKVQNIQKASKDSCKPPIIVDILAHSESFMKFHIALGEKQLLTPDNTGWLSNNSIILFVYIIFPNKFFIIPSSEIKRIHHFNLGLQCIKSL